MIRYALLIVFCFPFLLSAQDANEADRDFLDKNKPERLEWLQDAGFGMFIHFSFDSQLGMVISHSMAGASSDYLDRFINELPKTFNPRDFSADDIAVLAKLAGMKYIVLTTKHHSGYCLWDTKTTPFNIMNTPYAKDMLDDYVKACRKYGLQVGFYFSPEDFYFLHQNGQTVRRRFPEPIPDEVMKKYVEYNASQLKELMSNYGKIDLIFFDGGVGVLQEEAKRVVWDIQPDILVTRGAISTPEQTLPGIATDAPWEACVTMGTQWQFKPTHESYKSGSRLIELLIESRAKGGTFLLNVGPRPDGKLPVEQEDRLREMGAWTFINQESIYDVRPWILTNEGNIWYTASKDRSTLYAILTRNAGWSRGERKEFTLKSVKSTPETKISVLGQSGELVEYNPEIDATARFEQDESGLQISVVRAQRIHNDHKWPNPIVVKLEQVEPALIPPVVKTVSSKVAEGNFGLHGSLEKMGDAESLEVGFAYRPYAGFAENLTGGTWEYTPLQTITNPGDYSYDISGLDSDQVYEFRAVVRHPSIEMLGDIQRFTFP